jgi:hypothetical protein
MVNTLDIAQKTRFVSILMKWSPERWAEWAEKEELDGRCINFVLLNPEIITQAVNPRSLTTFFYSISSIKVFEEQLNLIQMLGEGSVGNEVASLFTTFIHNKLDRLITPKQMLNKGTHEEIKIELLSHIQELNNYRADIASVLGTRFLNYVVNLSKTGKVEKEQLNRIKFLIKDEDIFTNDMKYHLVKKLIAGNRNAFKELTFDPKIQEYATK